MGTTHLELVKHQTHIISNASKFEYGRKSLKEKIYIQERKGRFNITFSLLYLIIVLFYSHINHILLRCSVLHINNFFYITLLLWLCFVCVLFWIQREGYCILFWESDTNPAIEKQVDIIP